jgi:pilus assembly protein CpaF
MMSRPSYTTNTFGLQPQDYLGPALMQTRRRQWQQELPESLLEQVRFHLLDTVPTKVLHPLSEPRRRERFIRRAIREWLEQNQVALFSQGGEGLIAYLYGEIAGFGPLQPLLADPEVTEIKLIDPSTVLVEQAGRRRAGSVQFTGGMEEVRQLALRLAELGGTTISRRNPVAQVQLADGSRILLMPFEEIPQIFIRRRAATAFSLETLLEYGTLDETIAAYLRTLARSRAFFLVAGPSGSGKTAFLEMLLTLFPPQAHIVVVQQGTEIRKEGVHSLITLLEASDSPDSPNSLEAVAMQTLKMGVISLVIGEIKGPEAAAILHGISAGVKGGGATIHTDDAAEAMRRLARLARSSRFTDLFVGATPAELRQSVARSVHVVVQLEQAPTTGTRYVRQISEVEVDDKGWKLHPVFIGHVHPTAEGEQVGWEQLAESCSRIQKLLSAYVETGEIEGTGLEAERQEEAERLLASAAALARAGEWAGAEQALKQVLELVPEKTDAHQLLERVQNEWAEEREASADKANRLLEQARQAAESGDLARLEWLYQEAELLHLGNLTKELAGFLWKTREEILPAGELFALALEQMGQDDQRAAQLLRVVLHRQPDHPEAGFYLGLVGGALRSPVPPPPHGAKPPC